MARYKLSKNTNRKSTGYNKYYAKRVPGKIIEMDELAKRMAARTSSFSEGECYGILTDLVDLILELCFQGDTVKIKDLALFYLYPSSKGVFDPTDFDQQTMIKSKLRARATGDSANKNVGVTRANGVTATWTEIGNYTSPRTPQENPEP